MRFSATLACMLLGPVFAFFLSSSPASAAPQGFASGTVYVTNLNLNTVTAIDASNSHATVLHATNPQLNGPLGIAIAPDGSVAELKATGMIIGAIPMPAETSETARLRWVSNQPVTQAIIGAKIAAVEPPPINPNMI